MLIVYFMASPLPLVVVVVVSGLRLRLMRVTPLLANIAIAPGYRLELRHQLVSALVILATDLAGIRFDCPVFQNFKRDLVHCLAP